MTEEYFVGFIIQALIFANIIALAVGMLLFFVPRWVVAASKLCNRWISMRRLIKPLDALHPFDDVPLRRPDYFGVAVVITSGFILIQGVRLLVSVDVTEGGRLLADLFVGMALPAGLWESLWLTLLVLLVFGALLGLLVGALSLFNITGLRALSDFSNRWISARRILRVLDAPINVLDVLIMKKPRVWGLLITVFSLYALATLIRLARYPLGLALGAS